MIDNNGKFKEDGPIVEIRWIAQHPTGYYKMEEKERTDYKMNTKIEYTSCTVIHSPYLKK